MLTTSLALVSIALGGSRSVGADAADHGNVGPGRRLGRCGRLGPRGYLAKLVNLMHNSSLFDVRSCQVVSNKKTCDLRSTVPKPLATDS